MDNDALAARPSIAPSKDDRRFLRMRRALLDLRKDRTRLVVILNEPKGEIREWFQRYDIGNSFPTTIEGLRMVVGTFRLAQETIFNSTLRMGFSAVQGERIESFGSIGIELTQHPGGILAVIDWDERIRDYCDRYLACLFADMDDQWPGILDQIEERIAELAKQDSERDSEGTIMATEKRRAEEISPLTQQRFEVFSRIKSLHPLLTQEQVAFEAQKELKEEFNLNAETVRNTYRTLGVKWLTRGDRKYVER